MTETTIPQYPPTALLSYAPFQDESDLEQLIQLQEKLEQEVRVQTGKAGKAFQVTLNKDLKITDDYWIETSQNEFLNPIFLIVLITPDYLTNDNCRKELAQFLEFEKKLGRNDLIFPVLYIEPPDLLKEIQTPVFKELINRQRADWQSLRFESITTPESRKKLAELASGISKAFHYNTKSQRFTVSQYAMNVKRLDCSNFRGFHDLFIEFDPRLNVIVGINGAGKSTILEGVALLLSQFESLMRQKTAEGMVIRRRPLKEEITIGESETSCKIEVLLNDDPVGWKIGRTKRTKYIDELTELQQSIDRIHDHLAENDQISLPILVYYSVNRAVSSIELSPQEDPQYVQQDAYRGSLDGVRHDFSTFFEWFRQREDLENELLRKALKKEAEAKYEDPQLKAVRKAISILMPGFSEPCIQRSPLSMVVTKDGVELSIDQLSEGQKCLLALVGDLAGKLSIANPSFEDPLQGSGVVLIDEIDLHLHPDWQRNVIPRLLKTFPNVQFIVSTHSPQVLSEVPKECVFILEAFQFIDPTPYTKGRDSNSILIDVMGTSERPIETDKQLKQCLTLVDKKKFDEAREKLNQLRELLGDNDPKIARINTLINFWE